MSTSTIQNRPNPTKVDQQIPAKVYLVCKSATCDGKTSVYYLAEDGRYSCGTCCKQLSKDEVKSRLTNL